MKQLYVTILQYTQKWWNRSQYNLPKQALIIDFKYINSQQASHSMLTFDRGGAQWSHWGRWTPIKFAKINEKYCSALFLYEVDPNV